MVLHCSFFLYSLQDEALLSLVERLLDVAKPDSTPILSRNSALHGIQLLTKRLGNRYYSEFFKVIKMSIIA